MTETSILKTSYLEKLKDPRWQRKRLQILERDKWTCLSCGDDRSTLHVHHREYCHDAQPWEYDDNQLETLCVNCHHTATEVDRDLRQSRAKFVQLLSQCSTFIQLMAPLVVTAEEFEYFITSQLKPPK